MKSLIAFTAVIKEWHDVEPECGNLYGGPESANTSVIMPRCVPYARSSAHTNGATTSNAAARMTVAEGWH